MNIRTGIRSQLFFNRSKLRCNCLIDLLRGHRHQAFYDVLTAKRLLKFALTCSASTSSLTPRSPARNRVVSLTNIGSLRFPRCGTGARYGQSVSTRIRSDGTERAISCKGNDFGNVTIPENEIMKPMLTAYCASLWPDVKQ